MPVFGKVSRERLALAHPNLRVVFNAVIKRVDCTILETVRSPEDAARNLETGASRTSHSRHLADVNGRADAADAAPWPLQWPKGPADDSPAELKRWMKDYARYYMFGGYVLATADQLGIQLRWGGDWDGDWNIQEQNFDDLVHFEVVP